MLRRHLSPLAAADSSPASCLVSPRPQGGEHTQRGWSLAHGDVLPAADSALNPWLALTSRCQPHCLLWHHLRELGSQSP